MTKAIRKALEAAGLLICPECDGDGEVGYFCGHETEVTCTKCGGDGIIKSLTPQTHRETCNICQGSGGPGCCDNKGFHEWESYELI